MQKKIYISTFPASPKKTKPNGLSALKSARRNLSNSKSIQQKAL